jgi:hypothetical protein
LPSQIVILPTITFVIDAHPFVKLHTAENPQ